MDKQSSERSEETPQLPKGWVWTRIEEICDLMGGGTPSREHPEYFGGKIVWLTPTEILKDKIIVIRDSKERITESGFNKSSARLIPRDSVLLTSRASIGFVAIAGCEVTTNQGFASFVCSQAVFNFYLAFWLRGNKDFLEANATGTTFKEIPKSKIRQLHFPLPPLAEQHRIVAKIEELFSDLDAGVESLRKIQTQLKRYRQAVLKAAVEGKLTAEWRAANAGKVEPASVLLERIRAERAVGAIHESPQRKSPQRNTPVNAAELPELSEGWAWARVEEIANKVQYGTSEKADEDSTGIPVVRMGNIQDGKIDFEKLKYLPIDSPHLSDFFLEDGDVLFNRTNSAELVGKTAVYKYHYPKVVFASYLIKVKVNGDVYDPDMLSFFINSIYGRHYIGSVVTQQVGQANVNGTKLSRMPIPLASLAEQQQIVAEVEHRLSVADEVERTVDASLKQAARLRQSILKRAFAGKLVPQDPSDEPAERLVERIRAGRGDSRIAQPKRAIHELPQRNDKLPQRSGNDGLPQRADNNESLKRASNDELPRPRSSKRRTHQRTVRRHKK